MNDRQELKKIRDEEATGIVELYEIKKLKHRDRRYKIEVLAYKSRSERSRIFVNWARQYGDKFLKCLLIIKPDDHECDT